jgi:hypothetical protein
VFANELASCGRRIAPVRGFFSVCMKNPPLDHPAAARAVRREFATACRDEAPKAGGIITRDLALFHREIAVWNEFVDAALKRRSPRGPRPEEFQARARRMVTRDVAELRRLAACGAEAS